jgi:hypothetical protein
MDAVNIQLYLSNVLWVAFSIPSRSLLLVNHDNEKIGTLYFVKMVEIDLDET